MTEWIPLNKTVFINCAQCVKCEPKEGLRNGVRWGICGESGNIIYLEPWNEKRMHGSGCIHNQISSCLLYEAGSTHDARRVSDDR